MSGTVQTAEEKFIEGNSPSLQPVVQYFIDIYQTVFQQFGSWSALIQLGIIAIAGVLAALLARSGVFTAAVLSSGAMCLAYTASLCLVSGTFPIRVLQHPGFRPPAWR